jgi:hypothetical protein
MAVEIAIYDLGWASACVSSAHFSRSVSAFTFFAVAALIFAAYGFAVESAKACVSLSGVVGLLYIRHGLDHAGTPDRMQVRARTPVSVLVFPLTGVVRLTFKDEMDRNAIAATVSVIYDVRRPALIADKMDDERQRALLIDTAACWLFQDGYLP